MTYVNGKFFCHTIVSIHTPTKGVTKPFYFPSACLSVSIHTPTKGVTISNRGVLQEMAVSIHTPTKGVTCR